MTFFSTIIVSIAIATSVASTTSLGNEPVEAGCIVTSYNETESAVSTCLSLVISNMTVPAGRALILNLHSGSTVTFQGTIMFEYSQWAGPLVVIRGRGVTVRGAAGSVLDGQGKLYWEQPSNITKPRFFRIETNDNSMFQNISLLNCPINCVSMGSAHETVLNGWNIDCSEGDSANATGHNTDGFDVSSSTSITIENSVVKNQDDCVRISFAWDITVRGLTCSGGHGLTLTVGLDPENHYRNVVSGVHFRNCTVANSTNGIQVLTYGNRATGAINNIIYENIVLKDIVNYGILVEEEASSNGTSDGTTTGNIPIYGLRMINVNGTMSSASNYSTPVYIHCSNRTCADWNWSGVTITGAKNASTCTYQPNGYTC